MIYCFLNTSFSLNKTLTSVVPVALKNKTHSSLYRNIFMLYVNFFFFKLITLLLKKGLFKKLFSAVFGSLYLVKKNLLFNRMRIWYVILNKRSLWQTHAYKLRGKSYKSFKAYRKLYRRQLIRFKRILGKQSLLRVKAKPTYFVGFSLYRLFFMYCLNNKPLYYSRVSLKGLLQGLTADFFLSLHSLLNFFFVKGGLLEYIYKQLFPYLYNNPILKLDFIKSFYLFNMVFSYYSFIFFIMLSCFSFLIFGCSISNLERFKLILSNALVFCFSKQSSLLNLKTLFKILEVFIRSLLLSKSSIGINGLSKILITFDFYYSFLFFILFNLPLSGYINFSCISKLSLNKSIGLNSSNNLCSLDSYYLTFLFNKSLFTDFWVSFSWLSLVLMEKRFKRTLGTTEKSLNFLAFNSFGSFVRNTGALSMDFRFKLNVSYAFSDLFLSGLSYNKPSLSITNKLSLKKGLIQHFSYGVLYSIGYNNKSRVDLFSEDSKILVIRKVYNDINLSGIFANVLSFTKADYNVVKSQKGRNWFKYSLFNISTDVKSQYLILRKLFILTLSSSVDLKKSKRKEFNVLIFKELLNIIDYRSLFYYKVSSYNKLINRYKKNSDHFRW